MNKSSHWLKRLKVSSSVMSVLATTFTICSILFLTFFDKTSRVTKLSQIEGGFLWSENVGFIEPDTTTNIGAQVAALNLRIQTLEDGLLENPEKALAIPLIRKDIQKIEVLYKENIAAMNRDIDRVYDQNKWFIGLMFTMAIGLIGLAISNLVQVWKK